MGEASETTMTMTMNNPPPKKKKGRPSLLDLQKRFLQQQQNPHFLNPTSAASARVPATRRANPNPSDDDDDERAKKKHKLLLGINHNNSRKPTLPPFNSAAAGSDSNADDNDPDKISAARRRSNLTSQSVLKATDSSSIHGTQVEFGPTTPLPDKKLLVFILDRLQKKDTRGVFSEPVDPEELPDYHEIIENPMDFGTVREKLDQGAYGNLEQFEKDVFLISSNALQYNAPDTIYFRQARSIQELAKKDFENLRQDNTGDGGEVKPKVARRGRPPGSKTMKKSIDMAPVEHLGSQYFSETPGGETSSMSNSYNLRKAPASYKFRTAEALNRAPHGSLGGDTSANWLSELENEFPASVLRSVLRYGKKQFPVDENRRETYRQSLAPEHEPSVLSGLEGEWNQLMAVSVAAEEHGYARSLARFAANLGPVAWKIASKRIGSVLPLGVEFGPGWVGENDSSRLQQFSFREGEDKVQCNPESDDHKDRLQCQSTLGLNSVADTYSLQNSVNMENCREFNSQNGLASLNSGVSGIRSVPPFQNSMIHSGISSSNNTSVLSHHQMVGMFSERNMNTQSMPIGDIDSNEAKSEISSRSRNPLAQAQPQLAYGGETSWQGLSMDNKQVSYSLPPDLNVEFGAPEPSFEEYDPIADSWQPLCSYPYSDEYGTTEIQGYAVSDEVLLFSICGRKDNDGALWAYKEWEDVTLTEEEITTSINREKQVSEQQQAFPDPYQAEIAPQPRYEACSSSQPPEPSEVAEKFQQVSTLQVEALSEAIQHGAVSCKVKTGKRCTVKANQFCVVLPDKGLHQYDVTITPEVTSCCVNCAVMFQLVKLCRDSHLSIWLPAYDGRNLKSLLWMMTRDMDSHLSNRTYKCRGRKFRVVIKFAAHADLHNLGLFLQGRIADAPQKALQVCKIVKGQRYSKSLDERQITALLKVTSQHPSEKKDSMTYCLRSRSLCRVKISENTTQLKNHNTGKQKDCLPKDGQWKNSRWRKSKQLDLHKFYWIIAQEWQIVLLSTFSDVSRSFCHSGMVWD
ncbi:hypothetical protein ACLB2K_052819 [Fragaria x ananassa]